MTNTTGGTMGKTFTRAITAAVTIALAAGITACAPAAPAGPAKSAAASAAPAGPTPAVSAEDLGVADWPLLEDADWAAPKEPVGDYTENEVESLGEHLSSWVKVAVSEAMWHQKDKASEAELSSSALPGDVRGWYKDWEMGADTGRAHVGGIVVADDVTVHPEQSRILLGWDTQEGPLAENEPEAGLHARLSAHVALLTTVEGETEPQWMLFYVDRTLATDQPHRVGNGAQVFWNRNTSTGLLDYCRAEGEGGDGQYAPSVYPAIAGGTVEDSDEAREAYLAAATTMISEADGEYVSSDENRAAAKKAAENVIEDYSCEY
ncbi:hypothetical protein [Microbacterium sp. 77mftsu3.1]|uniref:hypothetical protein n=1 Tax=Microbacterium sp. 77mftsu3.1 TaxID=1761802 RepID=UPI00115F8749|nr:hypothetical protein [Microbacterium sp. 77mftsu3.1]